jgi:glycosyltransferase involved in cell wall biosynthesis
MHIVYATLVDPTGKSGQNIYSRSIATALESHPDVEFSLVCPEPKETLPTELSDPGVETHFLPPKQSRSLTWHLTAQPRLYQSLREVSDTRPIDGLVTTLRPSLLAPGLFARIRELPMALLVEGPLARNVGDFTWIPIARQLTDVVAWWNIQASDCVFTADATSREWIAAKASADVSVTQFGQGVDTDLFFPRDRELSRDKISSELRGDFVVGFVGSFKPYHCLEPLVEAIAGDSMQGVELLLLGEGPRHEAIKQRASNLGVANRVYCPGFVGHDRVPYYISACDALYGVISPDRPESPLKVYEYLACGRPVITLKDDEFAFVEADTVGVSVEAISGGAIRSAIQEIRDCSEEERKEMGERAWKYIEGEQTWRALAEEIVSCLKSTED